jgi:hypothetical protein
VSGLLVASCPKGEGLITLHCRYEFWPFKFADFRARTEEVNHHDRHDNHHNTQENRAHVERKKLQQHLREGIDNFAVSDSMAKAIEMP